MAALTTHPRALAAYMAACTVAGVGAAGLMVAMGVSSWGNCLSFAIPMALVLGLISTSAHYVCQSMPLAQRQVTRTIGVFVAASLISGIAWTMLCAVWSQAGGDLLAVLGLDTAGHGALILLTDGWLVTLCAMGSSVYLVSLLLHDVLLALGSLRQAQTRETESRLQARDAQLQTLRTQINPHFLFNSLNSISALTSIDAGAARNMTLELAQFFRKTLSFSERERIALSDELALCEHFLAVEKIRYGNKLESNIDVAPQALDVLIPPMLLQPLVENAIKHGVRHLTQGGTVTLRAQTQDDWLYIHIGNPVDEDAHPASEGTGTGLVNIQRRLASIYGDRARANWRRVEHGFMVELVLPLSVKDGQDHD